MPADPNRIEPNSNGLDLPLVGATNRRGSRSAGLMTVTGASHDEQMFVDGGSQLAPTSIHWFNQAMADPRLNHSVDVLLNAAKSGERADQYLTRLDPCIATNALYHLAGEGDVNDYAFGITDDQLWNGWRAGEGPAGAAISSIGVKESILRSAAMGMKVIVPTSWGQSSGMNDTTYGYLARNNQRKRDLCRGNPNLKLLDRADIILDGSATIGATRPGYKYTVSGVEDTTHAGTRFAYWAAQAAIPELLAWGFPANRLRSLGAASETFTRGSVQKLVNSGFLSASGGATGGSGTISGVGTGGSSIPSSWTILASAGVTVASPMVRAETSVISPGDTTSLAGNMNELVLPVTTTAAGRALIQQTFTANQLNPADIWEGGVEWEVAAGHVNFMGGSLNITMQMDGSLNRSLRDLYTQGAASNPAQVLDYGFLPGSEKIRRILKTRRGSAPSGTTGTQWTFTVEFYFGANASGSIIMRAPWMRRVNV